MQSCPRNRKHPGKFLPPDAVGFHSHSFHMPAQHIHLFIICPNRSGSTLWTKLLGTSPNVSLLPGPLHEGHVLPGIHRFMPVPEPAEQGIWSLSPERFMDPGNYDWPGIKKIWQAHWDSSRPVWLEKSPPNVVRAEMLEREFQPARFILSIRNPYAVCEAMLRKNRNNKTLEQIVRHWLACARFQLHNVRKLESSLVCTYEELTDDTERTIERLVSYVPELGQLNSSGSFSIKANDMEITNLNQKQISDLLPEQIGEISAILEPDQELLAEYGYSLIKCQEDDSFSNSAE